MPTEEQIHATVQNYVARFTAGDAAGVAALYAAEATIEDPLGTPLLRGQEIADFYQRAADKRATIALAGPVRAAANQAATPLRATVPTDDGHVTMEIVDVMTFDDDGRITSMRAFWGPANVTPSQGGSQ